MVIRKVQFAPDKPIFQPVAKTCRLFLMSDKCLQLEASLNKEVRVWSVINHPGNAREEAEIRVAKQALPTF